MTKDFRDTVQARAQRYPAFRKALLREGVECLFVGDVDAGKAVLRDYINATIGFEKLSQVFDKSSKSLMRGSMTHTKQPPIFPGRFKSNLLPPEGRDWGNQRYSSP